MAGPWEKYQARDPAGFVIDTSRPKIQNADGSFSTEKTITVGFDDRYFNIPTIVNGREVSADEAIKAAQSDLSRYPNFASEGEALTAAKERSARIGEIRGGAKPWEKYATARQPSAQPAPWPQGFDPSRAVNDPSYTPAVAAAEINARPAPPEPGVGRSLGLGTRATIEGLGLNVAPFYDAAGAVTNLALRGVNEATGADLPYVRPFAENMGRVNDAIGLPTPATGGERIMSGIVRGAASVLPSMGVGVAMADAAPRTMTRAIGDTLKAAPAMQVAGGATGGGLSAAVGEVTDNPYVIGAADVLGNLGAYGVQAGIRGAMRGGDKGRKAVARAVEDFGAFNASPTVAQSTGGWLASASQSILSRTPGGASRMLDVANRTAEAAAKKIRLIVDNATPTDAGRKLAGGVRAAGEAYAERGARIYDEAYRQVEETASRSIRAADMQDTRSLIASLRSRLNAAPATARESVSPALARAEALLSDIATNVERGNGGLSFSALRQARTALGEDLKTAGLMGVSGSQETPLNALYAALTADMNRYATKFGAGDAIKLGDRYWRAAKNRTDNLLGGVTKEPDYAKVFEAAAREDATTMRALRSAAGEDAWSETSRAMIDRLGRATPGNQNAAGDAWSFETFLTNYNRLPERIRATAFGRIKGAGNLNESLDAIARAAESVRKAQRVLANPSGTAAAATNSTAAGLFVYSLLFNPKAAGLIAAGATGANLGARLMTSPRFVRFLAGATRMPVERVPSLLMRLADIAKAEPENADAIAQFVEQFKSENTQDTPRQ